MPSSLGDDEDLWHIALTVNTAVAQLVIRRSQTFKSPSRAVERDDYKKVAEVGNGLTRRVLDKSRLVSSGWSMSALPPKADIRQRYEHVCFVP
jgi:hypothetical protein